MKYMSSNFTFQTESSQLVQYCTCIN